MANPQITAGASGVVGNYPTTPPGGGSLGFWAVYSATSTLLGGQSAPNGWNVVVSVDISHTVTVTVPAGTASQTCTAQVPNYEATTQIYTFDVIAPCVRPPKPTLAAVPLLQSNVPHIILSGS